MGGWLVPLQAALNKLLNFPGSCLGLASFCSLWLRILPFPCGHFTLALIVWPVYTAGLQGEMVPSRVEVGSWSPSLLLGAGILEPWLRLSPHNPGWRSSRGQMRKRWVEQNPCATEIFLPEKWEGGGAPASLAAVAACFHCDANLFV